MKRAVILIGIVGALGLGFLWVGSTHRDRCLRAGNTGCSMLPWSGAPESGAPSSGTSGVVIP